MPLFPLFSEGAQTLVIVGHWWEILLTIRASPIYPDDNSVETDNIALPEARAVSLGVLALRSWPCHA